MKSSKLLKRAPAQIAAAIVAELAAEAGERIHGGDGALGPIASASVAGPGFLNVRLRAGLLADLEQRGLLDETLVVWGGEFGRQPVSETFNTGGKPGGRDHNPKGFTYWMAGGGVKAGTSYGETDEVGEAAEVNRHHLRDLHATILHLMGFDHERLTYFHGGLNQKLTGVLEAQPIRGILA
jgi:hypothetical protein